jgi:NAD(P)H-dependent FMN reductase
MKLHIIIGATRQGRVSDRVGKWVQSEASKLEGVDAELLDLRDYPMPFFDEAISPQYNPDRKPSPEVQKWLDKVADADAYVVVTPEYNRSTSAVLKNALDYLDFQFAKKPVGIVAHGSTGGAQAVAQLRGILPGVQAISVPAATFFSDRAAEHLSEDGQLSDELSGKPYGPLTALQNTLKETVWYANALAAARDQN